MELITPPTAIAHAGLRALKTVAMADGELHALERRFLESVQTHILHTEFDIDPLEPISPAELAAAVTEPLFRERIIAACVVTSLIDGEASEVESQLLKQFSKALGVMSDVVADVQRLVDRNLLVLRLDILRRGFIGQRGRAYLANQGIRGFARTVRSVLGIENPALAARYQALEQLPRGTLGREYFQFVRDSGFALPGEKDAAPEVIVFHDCLHVLGGYGTVSLEETQVACFQAGILKRDSIYGLLFMLAQFHLGVQVTPVTPAETLVGDPMLMLQAFARGAKVTRDLCVDWMPSDDFARTLDELRAEYNIPPR